MLGRRTRAGVSCDGPTRRDMLRTLSAGVFATAGAGVSGLFGAAAAHAAATTTTTRLPATMILKALPADASPALIQAIEAGCCITYTRDEHRCTPDPCPAGECCYHVVSTECGISETICIDVSCAEGNFSTGC